MAKIIVSDANGLSAALASVKPGDTIALAGGDYGNLYIKSKVFSTDVNIVALDAKNPPVFDTITVYKSQGVNFVDLNVKFTPTETTVSFESAVKVSYSSDISFTGGEFQGGPAVNGVSPDALALDKTGNVIGMPAARGITVQDSKGVTIEGVDIHHFHKGIALVESSNLVIRNNDIHDLRTSSIVGGGLNDVVIDGNHMWNSNPFRWGSIDHGDFIHIWTTTDVGQSSNLTITNNVIEQGTGEALLGIYLDDNRNALGFTNVTISDNLIMNGDHQGLRLENVYYSKITDNVLLQTSGTSREAPGITFAKTSHDNVATGNITAFVSGDTNTYNNNLDNSTIVQSNSEFNAGYYSADDLAAVAGLSPAEALAYMNQVIAAWTPLDVANLDVAKVAYEAQDTDANLKVTGSWGKDSLVLGGRGSDSLSGRDGHDTLVGGDGNDLFNGGAGHDVLQGGAGADTFNFAADYPGNGGFDIITDFSRAEGDRIRLHSIDANSTNAVINDSFDFIGGGAFTNAAGQLRYSVVDGNAIVEGDTNGDGVADFSIKLMGLTELYSTDFVGAKTLDKEPVAAAPVVEDQSAIVENLAPALTTETGFKLTARTSSGETVVGGAGADTLTGRGGDDTINGGAGNDLINGNGGGDMLKGGAGADRFNFTSTSGTNTIVDFSPEEGDLIRLHSMDANSNTDANEAFTFIGTTAFSGTAGELRYSLEGSNAIVQGDLNGDGVADLSVKLVGVGSLSASDFIL